MNGNLKSIAAQVPWAALPLLAIYVAREAPSWQAMLVISVALLLALKGATFAACDAARGHAWMRQLAYLLAWPGMNAREFFSREKTVARPQLRDWLLVSGKIALGVICLCGILPMALPYNDLVAGGCGVLGLLLVSHFGLFHALALAYQTVGIRATPIMHRPLLATSLVQFWGDRWNRAFRDAAHLLLFRPCVRTFGAPGAMALVFLASGLVHELAISVPARQGYGGPTLYFLVQGLGLYGERTAVGKQWGLGQGWLGWLYCLLFTALPVGLLFHAPFLRHVILPLLDAAGCF